LDLLLEIEDIAQLGIKIFRPQPRAIARPHQPKAQQHESLTQAAPCTIWAALSALPAAWLSRSDGLSWNEDDRDTKTARASERHGNLIGQSASFAHPPLDKS
jgi:hypothetical protein